MPTLTADSQIRDQLKKERDILADLRTRRAEAKKERDAAKEAFAGTDFGDAKLTDTPEFKAAEDAIQRVGDLDDEIEAHRQSESGLLKLLGDSQGDDPLPPGVNPYPARGSWDAHRMLADSDSYRAARERGDFTSMDHLGPLPIGQLATRSETANFLRTRVLAADLPGAPAGPVGTPPGTTIVPADHRGLQPPRLPTLLDIFPVGETDSNKIDYVQITAIPDDSDVVEEGALVPETGLTMADETANVVTIAGRIKLNRNALDDVPFLGAQINTLLPYDVRRKAVRQLIAGDGTGQNLRGLYHTTGVGEPETVGTDNIADTFLRAITVCVLSDSEPNFAALNPLTWQDLMLLKNAQGNYLYGSPGQLPGGSVAPTIWGLTITTNRAIPQARPIVGESMAAMVVVREGVSTKMSDSDEDDFSRRRVTVLAETRIGFVIWRPSGFAIVNVGGGDGGGDGGDE